MAGAAVSDEATGIVEPAGAAGPRGTVQVKALECLNEDILLFYTAKWIPWSTYGCAGSQQVPQYLQWESTTIRLF